MTADRELLTLAEQLRDRASLEYSHGLLNEAADAIDLLVEVATERNALAAEVQRLRVALERMEQPCPDCDGDGCEWCGGTGFEMRSVMEIAEIRRQALAGDGLDIPPPASPPR